MKEREISVTKWFSNSQENTEHCPSTAPLSLPVITIDERKNCVEIHKRHDSLQGAGKVAAILLINSQVDY